MSSVIDLVEYYKDGKISKESFENELSRAFPMFANMSVVLDDSTTLGSTNASYIAMVVPERINGIIKNTLIIDAHIINNVLDGNDVVYIISKAEEFVPVAAKALMDFYVKNKEVETAFSDCILAYVDIYDKFIHTCTDNERIKKLIDAKTIDLSKIDDVKLAIENRTEKASAVVEYCQVNKIIPTFALNKAEAVYKKLNKLGDGEVSGDKPVENYWYAKLVSHITGTFNPQEHHDLDPFYRP